MLLKKQSACQIKALMLSLSARSTKTRPEGNRPDSERITILPLQGAILNTPRSGPDRHGADTALSPQSKSEFNPALLHSCSGSGPDRLQIHAVSSSEPGGELSRLTVSPLPCLTHSSPAVAHRLNRLRRLSLLCAMREWKLAPIMRKGEHSTRCAPSTEVMRSDGNTQNAHHRPPHRGRKFGAGTGVARSFPDEHHPGQPLRTTGHVESTRQ